MKTASAFKLIFLSLGLVIGAASAADNLGGHVEGRDALSGEVAQCGVVSNKAVDNAQAINNCLKRYGTVKFPAGDYSVSDQGIQIPSRTKIIFAKGARVLLLPSSNANYQIFNISGVEDVEINNVTIVGDKYTHTGTAGEWGMGIAVLGSRRVKIHNPAISKCWCDAIYISDKNATYSDDVTIDSARLDDNRRQGISIISGKNIKILSPTIINTRSDNPGVVPLPKGPHGGIDLEPNKKGQVLDVYIKSLVTRNNQGPALLFVLGNLAAPNAAAVSILVDGHIDRGSRNGLLIQAGSKSQERLPGTIEVKSPNYADNQLSSVIIRNYSSKMPQIKIENPHYKNWGRKMWRGAQNSPVAVADVEALSMLNSMSGAISVNVPSD